MPTYIAFLRAVNVGKRKYPMAELRDVLTEAGYDDVATHIQTGNALLTTPERSRAKLATALEKLFEKDRGFEVTTVVFTPEEVADTVADAAEVAKEPPKFAHYVSLLADKPTAAEAKQMEQKSRENERVFVRGRAVHLLYDVPYHEARTSNAAVEKILGPATNRNLKVLRAIAEKWAQVSG